MWKKLFTPYEINGCTIPNRLAVSAMVTNYCDRDGRATRQYIAYHEEKAKGGWGLIVTEDYAVSPHAMGFSNVAGLYNDNQIKSHKMLTDAVHRFESKIFAQIYHAGRQTNEKSNHGAVPQSPSAIPCPVMRQLPRELTEEEIAVIVANFGQTALRAQKAGFDGIEVHAAHGYLLAQFLSPYSNKRTDCYGGIIDNRARIVREVLESIRANVGSDFPVTVRYSCDEEVEGGHKLPDALVLARLFEEWGFDALQISASLYCQRFNGIVPSMYTGHGWLIDSAAMIKQAVGIPVFVVGRINDPRMAENVLLSGKADFVSMGRASLADPWLPAKAKRGELDSIRYCTGCLKGCSDSLKHGKSITCMVNPSLGQEYKISYTKTDAPKNIVVVGGGPCGMEAARVAALRGHKVSLYEQKLNLGGKLRAAAYPPYKHEYAIYVAWAIKELEKNGVMIYPNTKVEENLLEKLNTDKIVLAGGQKPLRPPTISGIDRSIVHFAEDVLLGNVQPGDNIVILGGGEVGCETALFIGMQERRVTVIEQLPCVMQQTRFSIAFKIKQMLTSYDVELQTNTVAKEILDDGVWVCRNDQHVFLAADMVVLALGYKQDSTLYNTFKSLECRDKLVVADDNVCLSDALLAIRAGFEIGISI